MSIICLKLYSNYFYLSLKILFKGSKVMYFKFKRIKNKHFRIRDNEKEKKNRNRETKTKL